MLVLALATNAHAALTLQPLTPLKAGAQNTASATGATANHQISFAYGLAQGNSPVAGCPNLTVPIANLTVLGSATASAQGNAQISSFVPASASGRTVRMVAIDTTSCVASNVTINVFPQIVWADVEPIFSTSCSGGNCHWHDNTPGGHFSLFGPSDMVNVASFQVPNMDRVEPRLPDRSYVWYKLNGTQAQVGGSGARMPKGKPALNAQQMSLIEQWIVDGAQ